MVARVRVFVRARVPQVSGGPFVGPPEHQSGGGDHAVSLITKITDKDGKTRAGMEASSEALRGDPECHSG